MMARKVTAYSCDYKCGQKVVLSKVSMLSHESRCFHNPANKACVTCVNFEKVFDSNGMEGTNYLEEWVELVCKHDEWECMDKLQHHCEHHKAK
jgi:hypothetical protein